MVSSGAIDVNLGNSPESFVRAAYSHVTGIEPPAANIATWAEQLRTVEYVRRIDVVRTFCNQQNRACTLSYSDPWTNDPVRTAGCVRKTSRDVGAVMMFFFNCPKTPKRAMDWANTHAWGMAKADAIYEPDPKKRPPRTTFVAKIFEPIRPGAAHGGGQMREALFERGGRVTDLYERYHSFVARRRRSLGMPESLVDDAGQDVYLVAFRRIGDFRGEAHVKMWLSAIAQHVASNGEAARVLGMNANTAYSCLRVARPVCTEAIMRSASLVL